MHALPPYLAHMYMPILRPYSCHNLGSVACGWAMLAVVAVLSLRRQRGMTESRIRIPVADGHGHTHWLTTAGGTIYFSHLTVHRRPPSHPPWHHATQELPRAPRRAHRGPEARLIASQLTPATTGPTSTRSHPSAPSPVTPPSPPRQRAPTPPSPVSASTVRRPPTTLGPAGWRRPRCGSGRTATSRV